MHRGLYEKTKQMENNKFVEPQYNIEEISKSKPIFVQPLSDPKPIGEGRNIHLECRLEPMGDPTMRVEWFQNGRPVTVGELTTKRSCSSFFFELRCLTFFWYFRLALQDLLRLRIRRFGYHPCNCRGFGRVHCQGYQPPGIGTHLGLCQSKHPF